MTDDPNDRDEDEDELDDESGDDDGDPDDGPEEEDLDDESDDAEEVDDDEESEPAPPPAARKRGGRRGRKQEHQQMAKQSNRRPILREMPVKEIKERIAQGYVNVVFRISRNTLHGRIGTVEPRISKPLTELLSGEFEAWLQEHAGGGEFCIETRDPENPAADDILPRFWIVLHGPPRDPKRSVTSGGAFGGALPSGGFQGVGGMFPNIPAGIPRPQVDQTGHMTLPPQDQIPAMYRTLPAKMQWDVYYNELQKTGSLPPGASIHSDAMAMQFNTLQQGQMAELKAENAKLHERLNSLTNALGETKAKEAEHRYKSELAELRAEIRALTAAPKEKQTDWAPVVAAAAPVVVAWLQAQSSNSTAQLKASQDQMTALMTVLKPEHKSQLIELLPAIAPIGIKLLESFGPTAKAEAEGSRLEAQMMMLQMIHQMFQAQAGDQPPPWYPLVQSVIESLGEAMGGGNAAQMLRNATGPRGLPPGPGGAPRGGPPDDTQMWALLERTDPEAAAMTKQVWMVLNQNPELGFGTHEWRLLLFNLHRRWDPNELSLEIFKHLQHCRDFLMLPQPLEQVFTQPETALELVFGRLPLAQQDPTYVAQLLKLIVERIKGEAPAEQPTPSAATIEFAEQEADDDEDGDDEDGEDDEDSDDLQEAQA